LYIITYIIGCKGGKNMYPGYCGISPVSTPCVPVPVYGGYGGGYGSGWWIALAVIIFIIFIFWGFWGFGVNGNVTGCGVRNC
jgi:hypothetical protein